MLTAVSDKNKEKWKSVHVSVKSLGIEALTKKQNKKTMGGSFSYTFHLFRTKTHGLEKLPCLIRLCTAAEYMISCGNTSD